MLAFFYGVCHCLYVHCNENPIYVFPEKELRGLSPNFFLHIHVSRERLIYSHAGSVHIFSCSRIGRPIVEYINRSQTHVCENWD
jgi:hypothetical protein